VELAIALARAQPGQPLPGCWTASSTGRKLQKSHNSTADGPSDGLTTRQQWGVDSRHTNSTSSGPSSGQWSGHEIPEAHRRKLQQNNVCGTYTPTRSVVVLPAVLWVVPLEATLRVSLGST
jgi:hypothetical protein